MVQRAEAVVCGGLDVEVFDQRADAATLDHQSGAVAIPGNLRLTAAKTKRGRPSDKALYAKRRAGLLCHLSVIIDL